MRSGMVVLLWLGLVWQFGCAYLPEMTRRFSAGVPSMLHMDDAASLTQAAEFLTAVGDTRNAVAPARQALARSAYIPPAQYVLALADQKTTDTLGNPNAEKLLKGLGWRHPDSQILLLQSAVARADYNQIIMRADALLRLRKLNADVISVLAALDSEPTARPIVARRLALNPEWREPFFLAFQPRTTQDVNNRLALIAALAQARSPISRDEWASTTNAIAQAQEWPRAYSLWQRTTSPAPLPRPVFAGWTDRPNREALTSLFEWRGWENENTTLRFDNDGQGGNVQIEWDGTGNPTFLSRYVHVGDRPTTISVEYAPGNENSAEMLEWATRCGERYVALSAQRVSDTQFRYGPLHVLQAGCSFPRLEVHGKLETMDRPISLQISQIFVP